MTDFTRPRTFILSACTDNPESLRTKGSNVNRTADLSCDLALEGIPFRECEGSYKGKRETSFVITGASNERKVRLLAKHFDQETYLTIAENDRHAYLVDVTTGYHKSLGRFIYHGDTEPDCEGWTKVDNSYFTTDGITGPDLPEGL